MRNFAMVGFQNEASRKKEIVLYGYCSPLCVDMKTRNSQVANTHQKKMTLPLIKGEERMQKEHTAKLGEVPCARGNLFGSSKITALHCGSCAKSTDSVIQTSNIQ